MVWVSEVFYVCKLDFKAGPSLYVSSFLFLCSYVLECANCGIIYRSRQYWMGNQDPESSVVRPEVKHVWQGVSHCSSSLALNVIDSLMLILYASRLTPSRRIIRMLLRGFWMA